MLMVKVLRHEWGCYWAEFIGVFAIVFFGCGAAIVLPDDPGKHLAVNLVFGAVVATMIYALGHVSRAHFNPAVTLGFLVSGRFPWRCAVGYWVAQFAGGAFASALHRLLDLGHGAGATHPNVPVGSAVALEAILTFFLMLVIVGSAVDKRANHALAGAAIGATVMLCGLFAGPLTGNSLNPARSFGPALWDAPGLASLWIYFVGPCLGAMAAALGYHALVGPRNLPEPDRSSCCASC